MLSDSVEAITAAREIPDNTLSLLISFDGNGDIKILGRPRLGSQRDRQAAEAPTVEVNIAKAGLGDIPRLMTTGQSQLR